MVEADVVAIPAEPSTPPAAVIAEEQASPAPAPVVVAEPQDVAQEDTAQERVAASVPLPAASVFNRPREDGAVVTPETDAVSRPSIVTEGFRATALAPRDAPAPRTQSAARPQETRVTGFGAVPEAGDAPNLPAPLNEGAPRTFADTSTAEDPESDAPVVAVEAQAEPDVSTVAPDAATGRDPSDVPAGEAAEVPETTQDESPLRTAQADGAETDGEEAPKRPAIRLVDESERVTPPPAEKPEVVEEAEPEPSGELPRRLVLDSEKAEAAQEPVEVEPEPEPDPGALVREAAAFENPENLPLLAVILIDEPDAGLDRESLAALDFPVTFAIDPARPDAAEAARAYRAAGHEVVLLTSALDPEGTAQDIEIAMEAVRAAVPQAVGLLDGAEGRFAGNRTALDALLPALAEEGMGLIAYPNGLNSGITEARRGGVPAMSLYRELDTDGERAAVITRYLDRATFEAVQDGAVVVVGRTQPDTVAALYSWRLGNRSGDVVPAPLSAVLLGYGG